jgi:diamine oxidase
MIFLHSRKELDLVKEDEMKVNSSYVYLSELHLPNKQSVLDYLDKKGQKPAREAHVILFRGDKKTPDIEEIIVGPLPNPTGYRKVPYRPQSIPFIYRPINGPESIDVHTFLKTSGEQILGNMLEELYGGRLLNCISSSFTKSSSFRECKNFIKPLISSDVKSRNTEGVVDSSRST